MRGDVVFDASAIINCVARGKARLLVDGYTVELVKYEIGNYLWKRVCLRRDLDEDAAIRALDSLLKLVENMRILPVDLREALRLAVEEGITLYDAAYLQAAISSTAGLVTDDERLYRAARRHVTALKSVEL